MDELLREFVIESNENLETIDRDLMTLERDPAAPDVLASVFRAMHTIKGTAGFFDLPNIERLAHAAESLLGKLRDGVLQPTSPRVTALLQVADTLRVQLASLEATETEGDIEVGSLIDRLAALDRDDTAELEPAVSASPKRAPAKRASTKATSTKAASTKAASTKAASTKVGPKPVPEQLAPQAAVPRETTPAAEVPLVEATQTAGVDTRNDPAAAVGKAAPNATTAVASPAAPKRASAAAVDHAHIVDSSIRVDIGVLDELMALVGELVLARNELMQCTGHSEDRTLVGCGQRINLITTDLRERVLKTRMRPVSAVWSAIPRLVRDTSLLCGKQVRVEMAGEETELDKTVLEAIKDPLTHCVRNSVDHGIETPAARTAAGKPPEGVLSLRASHENGNVVIEISDDGAGINLARVREKALENGLVTSAVLDEMTDRAVAELIFAPGFSTAAEVTNVSGRGVGMDVVRTNVERIGGSVEVNTALGQGSTFVITIPLTLAIIPALIVGCTGERYAIPQQTVSEIVRLKGDGSDIDDMNGAYIYRLRGRLLPLVDLRVQLGQPVDDTDLARHIVVLRTTGSPFGLIVDDVQSTEEIVVKPLGPHYASIAIFAGATVMGDGRVALILDTANVAQAAKLSAQLAEAAGAAEAADAEADTDCESVLLVEVSSDRRLALPLDRVARLEKFARNQLERTGDRHVVQYRDGLLPILFLDELMHGYAADETGSDIAVAVLNLGAGEVGIGVARILEVAQARNFTRGDPQDGTGTAIVNGRVIDIVDVDALFARAGIFEGAFA